MTTRAGHACIRPCPVGGATTRAIPPPRASVARGASFEVAHFGEMTTTPRGPVPPGFHDLLATSPHNTSSGRAPQGRPRRERSEAATFPARRRHTTAGNSTKVVACDLGSSKSPRGVLRPRNVPTDMTSQDSAAGISSGPAGSRQVVEPQGTGPWASDVFSRLTGLVSGRFLGERWW
jgi:hypothetical protein